jgi:hypothetical protein
MVALHQCEFSGRLIVAIGAVFCLSRARQSGDAATLLSTRKPAPPTVIPVESAIVVLHARTPATPGGRPNRNRAGCVAPGDRVEAVSRHERPLRIGLEPAEALCRQLAECRIPPV